MPSITKDKNANDLDSVSLSSKHSKFSEKEQNKCEEEEPVVQWDGKFTFLLTTIGFAVGFGNFWRFPKTVQENGGGVFFIPYAIWFFIAGVPLLYTELAVGQSFRVGSYASWVVMNPYMKGIGVCGFLVSIIIGLYYASILSWVVFYLYNSFGTTLPWSACPEVENLPGECSNNSAVEYFWYRKTLNISPSIEDPGSFQIHLFICLMFSWGIIVFCLFKKRIFEKAVWVTTLFPYVCLAIFFGKAIFLEGAIKGLTYLAYPKWEMLWKPNVWLHAATQIFFSLSIGFGGMVAFASKTNKKSNINKNTWIICVVNSLTSILACLIVFFVRGYSAVIKQKECIVNHLYEQTGDEDLARNNFTNEEYSNIFTRYYGSEEQAKLQAVDFNCTVEDHLAKPISPSGTAFIVFAEAINTFPGSFLFSIGFFLMLFGLGVASMFGNVEGILNPFKNFWTIWYPNKPFPEKKTLFVACFGSVCISTLFMMQNGNYWIDIFDEFGAAVPLLCIALAELLTVRYYGFNKFEAHVARVTECQSENPGRFSRLNSLYKRYTISLITPFAIILVLIGFLYEKFSQDFVYKSYVVEEGDFTDSTYPNYAYACAIVLTTLACGAIPFCMIHQYFISKSAKSSSEVDHEALEMKEVEDKE